MRADRVLRGALLIGAAAAAGSCAGGKAESLPNVIFILADDLGYGDLSCYGQQNFSTPNIDRMAAEGMQFNQHYAGCAVSAPSRSVLLSGQHMGHTYIRNNRELKGREGQLPIPSEVYTLAELFKDAGYATGAFGKWGLGYPGSEGDPNFQGFDEFFGYNCQRQAHRYYPTYLWHNQEQIALEGNDFKNMVTYAPDLIHDEVLGFIRENKSKPFFAYVPIIQPHAELLVPNDEIFAQYDGKFEETPFVAKPGHDYGSKNFNPAGYASQEQPHATFAAMVSRVDRYVGEIISELERLGIDDNTLVIFASDNGPHNAGGGDPIFFNGSGGYKGMKRDLDEGGIRVPMIAYWRGKIAPGVRSDHISAFYDFMPTFAEMIGAPEQRQSDGISLLPTLLGKGEQREHEFLYWEFTHKGGLMAVRMGEWKAIRRGVDRDPNAKLELYNLNRDPKETVDVAKYNPAVVAQAEAIMAREHTPSKLFPFQHEKE
ncbi:MAG: arylsulfatase [Rikenellaceae bacterium]